ncbi:unnamed protein product [Zymoseptoria tritici ST99CH_1A5]|uniref:JmjC domain-containing protein n=1 Tax=Zymoseptoria tritici ST99CH_1A5 TaxID=1276529 RepID=A0A1Y6L991_ZYMTR|nr:unnamed protein product [Zymoseptoria tritici ST99CH_1A5]
MAAPPSRGSLDRATQALVQKLHSIWHQQGPLSDYTDLRNALLSQRDQVDTRIVTLCSVTKLACPAAVESDIVVLYYGWHKAGQVQMSAIRVCATQYPRFKEDLCPRLNIVLIERHREGLTDRRRKTLDQAPVQPLRDLNPQLLASVTPDQDVVQQWVTNVDGNVAIDEIGTLLNEARPKHYHMYLLQIDRHGLVAARESSCTSAVAAFSISAHQGLALDENPDFGESRSGQIRAEAASETDEQSPHITLRDDESSPRDPVPDGPETRIFNYASATCEPASPTPAPQSNSLSASGEEDSSCPQFSHFRDSFFGRGPEPHAETCRHLKYGTEGPNSPGHVLRRAATRCASSTTDSTGEPRPSSQRSSILPTAGDTSALLGDGQITEPSSTTSSPCSDRNTTDGLCTFSHIATAEQYTNPPTPGGEIFGDVVMGEIDLEQQFSTLEHDGVLRAEGYSLSHTEADAMLHQPDIQATATMPANSKDRYCIASLLGDDLVGAVSEKQQRADWLDNGAQPAIIFAQPGCKVSPGHSHGRSELEADVLYYTSEQFVAAAQNGQVFRKPVVIKERFSDINMHTAASLALQLQDRSPRLTLEPRRLNNELQPARASLENLADSLRTGTPWDFAAAIRIRNIIKCQRPLFTMLPRFRLLECLVERDQGFAGEDRVELGSPGLPRMEDCLSFDICIPSGNCSDVHTNGANGTWLRVLDGTIIWMFVPEDAMEAEWSRFASQQGGEWQPAGKQRLLFLEQDDVLLLPPGLKIVQAMYSSTTAVLEGGLLWDELGIMQTLGCISWALENGLSTSMQSVISSYLPRLVEELVALVTEQPDRFRCHLPQGQSLDDFMQHVSYIKSLGCSCDAFNCEGSTMCPCERAGHSCTAWCTGHSAGSGCARRRNTSPDDYDLSEFMHI